MPTLPLKTILSTFATASGKHRTIYNSAPLGGLSSKALIVIFISLPFLEYGAIFNSFVFEKLGIATAIVAYIVFLSLIMLLVAFVVWSSIIRVIKKIVPSWNFYFKDIKLELALSNSLTPYSEFFTYLSGINIHNISDDDLYKYLQNSFSEMETKNKDLLDAFKRDNKL
jgi:hypothetical protein